MNERIKKLRKNLNMTQQEFAEKIGLKQNSIALIESGKRNISERSILSIIREFGVDEIWLRTGDGEMFQPITQEEELAEFLADIKKSEDSDPIKKIVLAFMKLPKEKQELMKDVMQQMMKNK